MEILDSAEARVLGSLLEKQAVTPEYYPLTLNYLVGACNQKTSREPVMELSEGEVGAAILGLRKKMLARYGAESGRDVSGIAYYRAFGFWKLACILQGVHVRYASGAAAGDRSGTGQFEAHVGRLGELALEEVESL